MTVYMGIDCGLTGAIAAIDTRTGDVRIEDMPVKETGSGGMVTRRVDGRALAKVLRDLAPAADGPPFVTCELVHAIAGKGQGQGSMQSMGSLMRTFGAVEAILDAMTYPGCYVRPQSWKSLYDLKVDEPDHAQRVKAQKLRAREVAMQIYPQSQPLLQRVKDHNRAEAVLLAHWGVVKHG